jgi:DNA-binding IclR family transcriptional regulator
VYRIVSELVKWRALERSEGGGYRVGLRIWEIGSLADLATSMLKVTVPFMQDLYEATHENVQLAIRDGHEALFIERIFGAQSAPIRSTRGGRLPLHSTGVGKILLAHAPTEFVVEFLATGLPRYTPYTLTTPGQLRPALAEIRRTGLALANEEMDLGLSSAAAPVTDANGKVVAAMSVVLRSSRSRLARLAPAVRMAALSASREMREHGVRGADTDGMLRMVADGRDRATGGEGHATKPAGENG